MHRNIKFKKIREQRTKIMMDIDVVNSEFLMAS